MGTHLGVCAGVSGVGGASRGVRWRLAVAGVGWRPRGVRWPVAGVREGRPRGVTPASVSVTAASARRQGGPLGVTGAQVTFVIGR